MKQIILFLTATILFTTNISSAHEQHPQRGFQPVQYTKKITHEQKEFDKILHERLNFTEEQKKEIKKNHEEYRKNIEKTIQQMEALQIKIRNVYLCGLPKWQTDLRTAPYKAELVLLKQDAENKRLENRKKFENILTSEQKLEFEKIKKEAHQKRNNQFK